MPRSVLANSRSAPSLRASSRCRRAHRLRARTAASRSGRLALCGSFAVACACEYYAESACGSWICMLKTCPFGILSSYTKNWHRRQHATSADQHSTTLLPLTRVIVRGAVSRRALGDGYCCQSPKDGHRVRKSARRRGHRPRLLGALVAAVLPHSCHLAVTFTRHSEISRLPSDGKATDLSGSDGRRSQAGRKRR